MQDKNKLSTKLVELKDEDNTKYFEKKASQCQCSS